MFCINFFRDPSRIVTGDERAIIAPADGKVIRVEKVDDPRVGPAWLVSIFLNIFNVHANRMPVEGTFLAVTHKPGKFLAAFDHAASDENEQTEILIQAPKGKVIVRQIAGLVARRILCYARENESMNRGDRLGFIMFGSRTDIIFPASVSLKIEVGQKTRGGETRIGEWT
ncbi:MAG: phosphatidylserine decarboxylase [Candidatus Neomarinimicrobiota bacterium]|nr:MAG: phosphatidylserine decarboxylase [Candidatus Neomarinimicrobiota bacterium]